MGNSFILSVARADPGPDERRSYLHINDPSGDLTHQRWHGGFVAYVKVSWSDFSPLLWTELAIGSYQFGAERPPKSISSFLEALQSRDVRPPKAQLPAILKMARVYDNRRIELGFRELTGAFLRLKDK
jgi:hypothetical protein